MLALAASIASWAAQTAAGSSTTTEVEGEDLQQCGPRHSSARQRPSAEQKEPFHRKTQKLDA